VEVLQLGIFQESPDPNLPFQVIFFVPSLSFGSDQRHPFLPIESELVEISINPKLGLADAFTPALPNYHSAFSFFCATRGLIEISARCARGRELSLRGFPRIFFKLICRLLKTQSDDG